MQSKSKVRRRVLACARCRRRKLSCDGKVPACTRCVDAGVQCVGFDSSTQQEAPRSLADFLEGHIRKLETQQNTSVAAVRQTGNVSNAAFPSPADSSVPEPKAPQLKPQKCAFADTLVNQVMEDSTPSFLGVSKARPLLQCVVRGTQLPSKKGPVISTDLNENHPRSILNPQPSKTLFHDIIPDEIGASKLFQNYLDRVITQYPIYHRNDVTSAFNSIYHKKATAMGEDSVRNRYIMCIIMAISLSTTARSQVRKANEIAYQLVRHAMQWIPEVATNDIAGLQAILLLTQYTFLNPRMADLWLLTGLISQAVIDLGLHQELPDDPKVTAYQRDMRRRLFWCAWEMEIGVCCIFLRQPSLPIRDIDVAFPLEVDDTAITQAGFNMTGRISKFTQRIICRFRLIEVDIISIMWQGHPLPSDTTLEQWGQRCIDAMTQWRQEIYSAAATNQDPILVQRWREMTLYSDIAYPYILVALYRASKFRPTPTIEQTMVALANAVQVADGYFQQSEAETGRIKYVFHPCHHVFNCALVFLQGLQHCKQEVFDTYPWTQVEEWMGVFAKCFSSIAERWAAAQRCLDEYERLLVPIKKECIDFLAQKVSLVQPVLQPPSSLDGALFDASFSAATPVVDIDKAYKTWTVFNPTTTAVEASEVPGAFVYNIPPRDWLTAFSLDQSISEV